MVASTGSYEQVQNALVHAKRGSYEDLSYLPTFRASALFYAVVDDKTNTKVSFINYWREKNGNPDVGVMVTVRNADGVKCARKHVRLVDMVYTFDVRHLISPICSFNGSIEIEAFSAIDLKFAFPGLSVFYETPNGVSYVHSNQRVYNDSEDQSRGEPLNPWQTGFIVDPQSAPFIFVVNGPRAWQGGLVDFVFVDSKNTATKIQVKMNAIAAYGAVDIRLSNVCDIRQLFGVEVGFCKINLPLEGVHLRLAVGNATTDRNWLSITHSYFDAVNHQDYFESTSLPMEVTPAFIPFCLVDELDVDIVLYPIYAQSTLDLTLCKYGKNGLSLNRIELDSFSSPQHPLRVHDIRLLLSAHGCEASAGLYVIEIREKNAKLPSRITYGLNYHQGNRIGTNISSSAYIAKSWGAGARSWKWGPIVPSQNGKNIVMVTGFSNKKDELKKRAGTITIFGKDRPLAQLAFELNGNSCLSIAAEQLLSEHEAVYSAGEILWYVVESDHSSLDVNQVYISANGCVGGDHSF